MSAVMAVSRSIVRAAFAVGATANTTRPCAWRSSAAAVNVRVLPAPAGPTTTTSRSSPATAAAAATCNGSRPSSFTVVDGDGGSAWAAIAHVTIASSWASTGSDVNRGAVGSIHTDRPSELRRVRVAGRVQVDELGDDMIGRPAPASPPTGVPIAATPDGAGRRSPATHRPGSTTSAAGRRRRSPPGR